MSRMEPLGSMLGTAWWLTLPSPVYLASTTGCLAQLGNTGTACLFPCALPGGTKSHSIVLGTTAPSTAPKPGIPK